jgi:hypothetical protein
VTLSGVGGQIVSAIGLGVVDAVGVIGLGAEVGVVWGDAHEARASARLLTATAWMRYLIALR